MKRLTTILTLAAIVFFAANTAYCQIAFTQANDLLAPIGANGAPGCVVDMNNDQLDDVVRLSGSVLKIDYQNTDGTYTPGSFLSTGSSGLWSICAGDIDGNGFNDLLLGDGSHVEFLYANETGTAYSSDLKPEYIFSQRSTFADIDNDGHLDAFVCHDVDQSHPYRNNGMGVLTEDQSLISTIDMPGNYSAIWTDYDNDHDLDLYITKCRGGATPGDPSRTNALYNNDGSGNYTEVGLAANMADNAQSWTTVFEDFDNDGDYDAFIVNHDFANRLMMNNGDGTFTDMIAGSGINAGDLGAWEAGAGDFDNDGWIDILSEVDGGIYKNNGDGTFTNISIPFDEGGIGDLNNDGFLDVFNGSSVYLNNTNANNWVKFSLQGIVSNKNAIGARVELYGSWGLQIREVRAGQSFSPMSSLTVHFGIGASESIDSVLIRWPSGFVNTVELPAINQLHIIPEADCLLAATEISTSDEPMLCPGESIEMSVEAGYEYLWSNGATTQSIIVSEPGNYSCILTDSEGCVSISAPVAVSIIMDETPVVSISGETLFCEGGSVMLSSSEAVAYTWSDGRETQSIEVSESGDYSVMIEGQCSTASSEIISITVLEAADVPVADDAVIGTPQIVTLTASGENIQWYETSSSTDILAEGPEFITPLISTPTSFFADAHHIYGGEIQDGGKEDNSGGGGLPSTGAYSYFTSWEPFTLQSVRVYAIGSGTRNIQLVNADDVILENRIVNLDDGEQVVDLNFEVPVGTDLSLRLPENNLFRNSSGVTYPYQIGTVGELTTSFYGDTYYYYFYDWKVQRESISCFSDREEVAIDFQTGIAEIDGLSGIMIYPNPADERATIQVDLEKADLIRFRVVNSTGIVSMEGNAGQMPAGTNNIELQIEKLASGLYQVVIENQNGRLGTANLLIQR